MSNPTIALDAPDLARQALLGRRTVLLGAPVDSEVANAVILQLLHLEAAEPGAPIRLLVNSPGGEVYAGLAIHDVLRDISSPVHTVCCGMAMSIASVILAAGERGHRGSYPNGRILIHQPSGGFQGQSSDVAIQAREAIWIRDHLEELYVRGHRADAREAAGGHEPGPLLHPGGGARLRPDRRRVGDGP